MKKLELKNIIREEVKIAKKIYEANRDVAKVYKPGDKISIKKYNNFDKKQEIIHGKVESVKNGVIKYTYTNFAGQQWGTVKVGDTNIVETSASGNAGPYMTPKAFTKPGQDYEGSPAANAMKDWTKTKRIDESFSIYGELQGEYQKIDGKQLNDVLTRNVKIAKDADDFVKKVIFNITDETNDISNDDKNKLKKWYRLQKAMYESFSKFSWPNVGVGDKIVDINDEKFKVLKKEKNRIFVKDLQSPNDEFWIEKDYAVKNGKYIIDEALKKEKFKLNGKSYDSFVFGTDDAANKFMIKNPGWGVIGVKGNNVYVADKKDMGINEQVDFKDENFSPKQKMAQAIRTVRESLKEVEKIVDKSRVFKEENNIKSIDMYKRSHAALKKIGEQMNRISNKLQAVK